MAKEPVNPWQDLGGGVYVLASDAARVLVNIGLVVGATRALVVDTGCGPAHAEEILAAVRSVTAVPLVVVNTHGHWDHVFGNATFVQAGVTEIWAHPGTARFMQETAQRQQHEAFAADPEGGVAPVELVFPTHPVNAAGAVLDLGGICVSLFSLGPAHSSCDLLVGAPGVLFTGDILEEGAAPAFEDSQPQKWLGVLRQLATMGESYPVMVPGHGRPVVPEFAAAMARKMMQH